MPTIPILPSPPCKYVEVSLIRLLGSAQHVISWVDLSELSVVLLLAPGCWLLLPLPPHAPWPPTATFLLPCWYSHWATVHPYHTNSTMGGGRGEGCE